MSDFRLIPYEIESVVTDIKEIPEGVKMIKAPEIWEEGHKGNGVVVAVIDTGCQTDHPDLKGRIVGGKNFSNAGNGPDDYSDRIGHGTHVAGTIAAVIDGKGVIGVAPEAKLLILQVFDKPVFDPRTGRMEEGADTQNIIKAIDYAINWKGTGQERVRVISMSLGGPNNDPQLHAAIKRAVENDILVVCAAGNEGSFTKGGDCSPIKHEYAYPGAYHEVVEVGAVSLDGRFPCFTNTNPELDLAAPGVNILSTYLNSGYARLNGTSMATPHVSGAAALIINQCEKDFGRRLSEPEIYGQLIKRTVSLGYSKFVEGNGLLDLTFGYASPRNPIPAMIVNENKEPVTV
ncbi:S8 family peptidase [Brevibacillus dissolubilis]|uniref:S8 family peptidase n=1 Tax=Brevibacillus dissolubilis TaxID=1844116 RepID=UPI0021000A6C|nr:S8 family peptidase [Brevibacillus dissolubilis]